MERLGVDAIRSWNHQLAWTAAQHLSETWGVAFDPPESMVPTMATVRLPESLGATQADAQRVRDRLLFEHRIEAPVMASTGQLWVRVSAQVYNDKSDIDRLGTAVEALAAGA